jgi:hypothetical protein
MPGALWVPGVVKRTEVMVKRIAVHVVSFCLVGATGALCQSERPMGGGLHEVSFRGTKSVGERHSQGVAWKSLPDAPSAQVAIRNDRLHGGLEGLPKTGSVAEFMRTTELQSVTSASALSFETVDKTSLGQKERGAFLEKYLYPSSSKKSLRYRASSSDSLMGRARDAASGIFVTRDDSGRRRWNTSYFVGVLTSVAAHNASRPYWARSGSVPIGDVGSTFGNDAGMNLLHEFGPGLRTMVTGHMPGFVFRIEDRIVRDRKPSAVVSRSAR